jgi:co-chaperonin GroES (HSP10)
MLAQRIERGTIKNGLIIPVNPNNQKEYKICAIGSEVKDIFIGDIVVVSYVINEIIYNEVTYAVIAANEIIAILPQE